MISRPRSVDCDVKPSIGQLQQHQLEHYQQQQQQQSYGDSNRNLSALLDELFIVLYDPKEICKLKLKQLHYCPQVPMRLRRLPKSFFVPSLTPQIRPSPDNQTVNKHTYQQRMKPMVGQPMHGHHMQYCCQPKAIQSGATATAAPDAKNNILFSSNNHHISFIEGHQYDARMYASIEVTATTLKYQKTLQLPPQSSTATIKSQANGPFLPPAGNAMPANGPNSWDEVTHYSTVALPSSQANTLLNCSRTQYYDSSDESSETEPNKVNDKVGHSVDYLDLDGFDNTLEFTHQSGLGEQHFLPYVPVVAKPIVNDFTNYTQVAPAPFSQPLDHLIGSKEPLDHGTFDALSFSQQSFNPAVISQFSASPVPNLWTGNTWN